MNNKIIFSCLYILAISFIYHSITRMSFSMVDDPWMLLMNKYAQPENFNANYLKLVFTRINDIQYSPLNTLYYALIFKINKFDPYYFHIFNVILHVSNAVMIMLVSSKLLQIFEIDNYRIKAIISAVIWSIHPINIEPVVWISGSKILLCTFFSLVSFHQFLIAFVGKEKNNLYYSALAFLVSLFIKEQGMMTPFMFILFLMAYKLRFRSTEIKTLLRSFPFYLITILISITFCLFTVFKVNDVSTINFTPIAIYPLYQRIILSFFCLRFYLVNLIFPVRLHYHYPYPMHPNEMMPISYYIFPLVFIFFAVSFTIYSLKSKNFPFIILCTGIFLIQLSLELQIIPMTRPAIMADRYMYLPSFSMILLCSHVIMDYALPKFNNEIFKRSFLFAVIFILIYYITYSEQLVSNWLIFNIAS